MTEVLLHVVRHAEPGYASDSEDSSAGLSARGRAQADALGARLRDRRVGAAARTVSLLLGEGRTAGRAPGAPLRLVLVTHAFVVGWFVRHALDAPRWRWMGLNPSHASLTVLHLRDGVPANLLGFDDPGHLTPDLRSGVVVDRP